MSIVKLIVSTILKLADEREKTSPIKTGPAASPSISNRLNAILHVSTGIMLISFILFTGYTVISTYQGTTQRMHTLAAILAINSEAPLVFSDRPAAEENLHSLSAIAEVSGTAS